MVPGNVRTGLGFAAGAAALCCAVLLLFSAFAASPAAAQSERAAEDNAYVHFFVVPATAAEGRTFHEEIIGLKKMLLDRAGGYTELGPSHGGHLRDNGNIARQDNISFVVSSTEDLREELTAYIRSHFGEDQPYVLVMRGWCSLY
jgi:hypothetical protein